MAERLLMMALSPTMEEGVLARWRVAEGEAFKTGQALCEVETDKATMDYEAPKAAVLLKIVAAVGAKARVGESIAIIGAAGEDFSVLLGESGGENAAHAAGTASPASGARPDSGAAASGRPAAPATSTPSPGGAEARPAAPVAATPAPAAPSAAAPAHPYPASGSYVPVAPAALPPSSPLARARALEHAVDLRLVRGSGPGGRVVERDVLEAAKSGTARFGAPPPLAAAPGAAAGSGPLVDEERPVAGKRAVIARRLSESFFTAPHFYLKRTVDVGRLLAARAALNAARGEKLSLNAYLAKLSAVALSRHPALNAGWKQKPDGSAVVEYRARVDVALAVALSDGLVTPVARDCGRKGVAAIDAEYAALIAKARAGSLLPEEYSGATFTISNLGSFGVEEFTAIINPPGSAILAVGAARKEPFVKEDGTIGVRDAMTLTLGCDHRVVDGAVGAAFLAELAALIEEPLSALL
ncbi:MAG TPA: dihydrolipoamide acetyltransferase family protein [Spirochaetales bacterium]|nr:dihydrolipoamide acetyltransferase family protein [Spirochaetales bacterium]